MTQGDLNSAGGAQLWVYKQLSRLEEMGGPNLPSWDWSLTVAI
jgi:hypothetical protein